MKRFFILAAAVLTLTAAQATDTKVSTVVQSAFNQAFKNAADVKWSQAGEFDKAEFVLNSQHVTAYYDASAQLVAVIRNISSTQLPITLQAKLKLDKDAQWITDLFELNNDNGTTYYVTVEDSDAKITYQSTGSGAWIEFSKVRKV